MGALCVLLGVYVPLHACWCVHSREREMCLHEAAMFVVFACMCINIDVSLHVFALASVMTIYFNYVYMCVCE